jgi:hypothetical protein
MSASLKVGDRVKMADANNSSLPAYRDMRGTIVETKGYGGSVQAVRVSWDCNKDNGEPNFRAVATVVHENAPWIDGNMMRLSDAGFREHAYAREMLRHLPVGVTYEDLLTHGVYDASKDTITITIKGSVFTRQVESVSP